MRRVPAAASGEAAHLGDRRQSTGHTSRLGRLFVKRVSVRYAPIVSKQMAENLAVTVKTHSGNWQRPLQHILWILPLNSIQHLPYKTCKLVRLGACIYSCLPCTISIQTFRLEMQVERTLTQIECAFMQIDANISKMSFLYLLLRLIDHFVWHVDSE